MAVSWSVPAVLLDDEPLLLCSVQNVFFEAV